MCSDDATVKHNDHSHKNRHDTIQNACSTTQQNESTFVPSPDEVSRRAYFAYENQGAAPGHDVQHWLKAEADLIAERNQTRVHGFHNRS